MKRTLNDITNKYQKKDDNEDKSINRSKDKDHDQVKTKRPTSAGKFYTLGKSTIPKHSSINKNISNIEDREDSEVSVRHKAIDKKEYFNKLSLERINFQFDDYGNYPDEPFQPSVFFFKFLSIKPDHETKKQYPKLKLFVPDTIILNDTDSNYWVYTDLDGNVCRTESFSDSDVIDKFKSPSNDENQLIGVYKMPCYKNGRLEENHIELLNFEELEKYLFSKHSNQYAIQKFVKCRGPKAFVCRSVWRRNKPPYVYILTNKANYHDVVNNQTVKFVLNSQNKNSYFSFHATSGKHLEETIVYMNNIVKFIECHSDIVFEELAGDFVKDEAGIWWFINLKAMKIKNIDKFIQKDEYDTVTNIRPNLDYFINRAMSGYYGGAKTRKFDYQTKIKCKFCGIDYSTVKLKYNLTTKMILETDKMLKHTDVEKNVGVALNFIERPDLKHTDPSKIYLPYRVCEDCYLLFETMNDIKNYQIEIANFFKNPVDPINFGIDYYTRNKDKKEKEIDDELYKTMFTNSSSKSVNPYMNSNEEEKAKNDTKENVNQKLYRILIMFTDLFWSEEIKVPEKDLYLLFNFIGNWYKVKIKSYHGELDYFNINFFKIFNIVCDETTGFIDYIEKNRHMLVKLGYFNATEKNEKQSELSKIFNKKIVIEDGDICHNYDEFVEFCSVELSLQGLKYGDNYRNILNGLLFKQEKPYYVGKLRCIIRINKEKDVNITKYNLRKHFNFYIPPVHFVISEELPLYWLELVERHKLRENILHSIFKTLRKKGIIYDKSKHKEEIFRSLETLVSLYLNQSLG